jgi:hypothetical protein
MESSQDLHEIVQRLACLESQNRWLKRGFFSLLVGAGAVLLVAAQPAGKPKEVQAEKFVVVDAAGKTRAILGVDKVHPAWEQPRAGLYIHGPDGKPQVLLMADEGTGGGLYLQEKDATRLGLVSRQGKMAGLVVYRKPEDRKSQIGLFYSDDGKPGFFLNDQNGTSRIGMILEAGGKPMFSMKDENGNVIFSQGR